MTYSFSKPVSWVFLFTAVIYLVSLSFIQYPATTVLKPIPTAMKRVKSIPHPLPRKIQVPRSGEF